MSTTASSSLPNELKAPLSKRDNLNHGHVVQFYSEDSFLLDELTRFIGTALASGGSAVVIATLAHRTELETRLKARDLDPGLAAMAGRYIALDAAETLHSFMRDGRPDPARFNLVIGPLISCAQSAVKGKHTRVAAFGEMVALLWAEGKIDAAIELEQLWNDLAKTHSFTLRCAYPIAGFHQEGDGDPFLKMCAAHSGVIPADSYTSLTTDEDRDRNIAELQQKEQAHEALLIAKQELEKEITERRKAEQKLRDSEKSLRELSGRILRMQDEERRHLGRELHDSVGQYLAVLKMSLGSLGSDESKRNSEDQRLADCLNLVEQCITEVRTMSYLLYPPMLEEMGLKTAIPWYLEGFAKRSGIETTLEISESFGRLTRDVEQALFRLLQEALTNIHRHSGSFTAHVRLTRKEGIACLEIKDAGKGMPADILEATRNGGFGSQGVGLRGMGERVRRLDGNLELFSTGQGTTVQATIPVGEPPSSDTNSV